MEEPDFSPQPDPFKAPPPGNPQGYQQQPYRQPGYQQPAYQQQPYPSPAPWEDTAPLSVGSYLVMYLISLIPIVNIVMMFVWGFGNTNVNKKNWARAMLIVIAVSIVLSVIFGASLLAIFANAARTRY